MHPVATSYSTRKARPAPTQCARAPGLQGAVRAVRVPVIVTAKSSSGPDKDRDLGESRGRSLTQQPRRPAGDGPYPHEEGNKALPGSRKARARPAAGAPATPVIDTGPLRKSARQLARKKRTPTPLVSPAGHPFPLCRHAGGDKDLSRKKKPAQPVRRHLLARRFSCPWENCGKGFQKTSHLKAHLCTHTGDKPIACPRPDCKMRCITPGQLRIHLRVHSDERPFACPKPDCEARFIRSYGLKEHLRIHTGARPFACPEPDCEARFARSRGLKLHLGKHPCQRRFLCPWGGCGKRFLQAGLRQDHLFIHTGGRGLTCPEPDCKAWFMSAHSLKEHLRIHRGVSPFACPHPDCHARFVRAQNLRRHLRQHGWKGSFSWPWEAGEKWSGQAGQLAAHCRGLAKGRCGSPLAGLHNRAGQILPFDRPAGHLPDQKPVYASWQAAQSRLHHRARYAGSGVPLCCLAWHRVQAMEPGQQGPGHACGAEPCPIAAAAPGVHQPLVLASARQDARVWNALATSVRRDPAYRATAVPHGFCHGWQVDRARR